MRIYFGSRQLLGMLAVNMAAAAAQSLVQVNTVVYVQVNFGLGQQATATAIAAFGCGGGHCFPHLAAPGPPLTPTAPGRAQAWSSSSSRMGRLPFTMGDLMTM